jgi:RNA polymerase sigma-70 factor (ECF subfamily)
MSLGERFPQVLVAAQAGESWAVAALYRDLQPALLAYLRSRTPGEAEDLAQETWIDVAKALGRFDGAEEDFRRLVFVIGKRRSIDHLRRVAARPTTSLSASRAEAEHLGDVEEEALSRLSTEEALAAVSSLLTPEQAEIVLLRVLGGFTAEEVASMLGRRPGTIRAIQHRAVRRLARALSPRDATNTARKAM